MSQYFKEPDTRPSKLPSRSSLPVLGGRRRLVNRTSRFTSNAETKTTLPEPSLSQRTIDQTPTPSSLPANTATHSLHDPTTTDRLQVALPPNTTTNNSDAIERCLKGVVVYLDIRTEDGDDVSQNFENIVKSMGAKVRRTFGDTVTHLIYKSGSSINVRKAIHNNCTIVSLLWITNCKSKGVRLPEDDYLIEQPENLLLPGSKKRKSMEPRQVKALTLYEPATEQEGMSTSSKQPASMAITANTLNPSKRSKSVTSKVTQQHNDWATSAIIPREATSINHYSGANKLKKSMLFDSEESSSNCTSGLSPRPNSSIGTSSQHQPTPSADGSATTKARNSFVPESQRSQVNQKIKEGFYIRMKPAPDTPKSPVSPRVQAAKKGPLTTNSSTVTPVLIRRKRRSLCGRSALMSPPTPTATDSFGSSALTHNRPDHLLQSISTCPASGPNDTPSIVMTGMTEQEKQSCFKIISILGTYRPATRQDPSPLPKPLHEYLPPVIFLLLVGSQRRTESVVKGLLYGAWLLIPDWLFDSEKSNTYLSEADYEAILLFPRAKAARQHEPLLPSNIHIHINQTSCAMQPDLVNEIVAKAGGSVVGESGQADIVISNTPMGIDSIVVTEDWLLDSVEQWRYLSTSNYNPSAGMNRT